MKEEGIHLLIVNYNLGIEKPSQEVGREIRSGVHPVSSVESAPPSTEMLGEESF